MFFSIAALAATARIFIRIRTRRIGLDDYLVLFALTSLCGATGLARKYSQRFFLMEAIFWNPAYIFTIEDAKSIGSVLRVIFFLNPLTWTATFAVKLSFLVFFRQFVKRVSKRITIYIWFVIFCTVLSWALTASEPFISCQYFFYDPRKLNLGRLRAWCAATSFLHRTLRNQL